MLLYGASSKLSNRVRVKRFGEHGSSTRLIFCDKLDPQAPVVMTVKHRKRNHECFPDAQAELERAPVREEIWRQIVNRGSSEPQVSCHTHAHFKLRSFRMQRDRVTVFLHLFIDIFLSKCRTMALVVAATIMETTVGRGMLDALF